MGFFGSLITNLTPGFQNSIWLIQDGGRKFEKLSAYAENLYIKVYRVADYESDLRFLRFNMVDQRWRPKIRKSSNFAVILYTKVF